MEYGRLQPLKGASAAEPTAFTKKTIKELLAEEGVDASEAQLSREPAPAPAQDHQLQAQPRAEAQDRKAAAFGDLAEQPAQKPKSLLKRLMGR